MRELSYPPEDFDPDANDNESMTETGHSEPCDRNYYGVGWSQKAIKNGMLDKCPFSVTPADCMADWENGTDISLKCFPAHMNSHAKFGYTLFFVLVPWPFFIYEFFTSKHYDQLVSKVSAGSHLIS
jgi:hypothetical protein